MHVASCRIARLAATSRYLSHLSHIAYRICRIGCHGGDALGNSLEDGWLSSLQTANLAQLRLLSFCFVKGRRDERGEGGRGRRAGVFPSYLARLHYPSFPSRGALDPCRDVIPPASSSSLFLAASSPANPFLPATSVPTTLTRKTQNMAITWQRRHARGAGCGFAGEAKNATRRDTLYMQCPSRMYVDGRAPMDLFLLGPLSSWHGYDGAGGQGRGWEWTGSSDALSVNL